MRNSRCAAIADWRLRGYAICRPSLVRADGVVDWVPVGVPVNCGPSDRMEADRTQPPPQHGRHTRGDSASLILKALFLRYLYLRMRRTPAGPI